MCFYSGNNHFPLLIAHFELIYILILGKLFLDRSLSAQSSLTDEQIAENAQKGIDEALEAANDRMTDDGDIPASDDTAVAWIMYQSGDYGVSYSVEVFPAQDYTPETAYYFDGDGKLVHILSGAPVMMPELGETFYTIHVMDTAVDESLFDLSGYAIEG